MKRVMLDMDSGHKQVLQVPDTLDIAALLAEVVSPADWLVFPTVTGGEFCVVNGRVVAINVEDA